MRRDFASCRDVKQGANGGVDSVNDGQQACTGTSCDCRGGRTVGNLINQISAVRETALTRAMRLAAPMFKGRRGKAFVVNARLEAMAQLMRTGYRAVGSCPTWLGTQFTWRLLWSRFYSTLYRAMEDISDAADEPGTAGASAGSGGVRARNRWGFGWQRWSRRWLHATLGLGRRQWSCPVERQS
jgi:hypothetical protein